MSVGRCRTHHFRIVRRVRPLWEADLTGRCNTPSAYTAVSVLHRLVESAGNSDRALSGLQLAERRNHSRSLKRTSPDTSGSVSDCQRRGSDVHGARSQRPCTSRSSVHLRVDQHGLPNLARRAHHAARVWLRVCVCRSTTPAEVPGASDHCAVIGRNRPSRASN